MREHRDTRVTCTIVPTVLDYGGGKAILLAYAHVQKTSPPVTWPRPATFVLFLSRAPVYYARARVVAAGGGAAVHARRCTRIIHVRATTEFVGHAVDRGESRTRGLNVIGRWLQTMLLERSSARARLIPRIARLRVPTYIYVLCRYDYLCRYQFVLHLYYDILNLVELSRSSVIYQKIFFGDLS